MTNRTEKAGRILSIALPVVGMTLAAVALGLVLSASLRLYRATQERPQETEYRTVTVGGIELPVSDDVVVERTASARDYLDGITDWASMDGRTFMEGIRRNHASGGDTISLQELTAYDYRTFMSRVMRKGQNLQQPLTTLHESYPIEIIIPIHDTLSFAVYRLLDGDREVYAYVECGCYGSADGDAQAFSWFYTTHCYIVTERLSFEDVASLRVGDTVRKLAEHCPAVTYQLRDSTQASPLVVILKEGILYASVDASAIDSLLRVEDEDGLAVWMETAAISELTLIPYGNTLTEEEKAALIEQNESYGYRMKYSTIPYMLLPE